MTDRLRDLAISAYPATALQIINIGKELATLSDVLADDEKQLHELTCRMFSLTPEERRLVEASRGRA